MKRWLTLSLILVCSTSAQAQDLPSFDAPCAPEVSTNRRAVLEYEGRPGIWFDRAVAACLLSRLNALPLYTTRVHLLTQRLALTDQRDQLREEQIGFAEQEAEAATEALEAAVRGRRRAEARLHVWYRSPVFLVAVGVLVTGALEALAIWALNRTP